MTPDESHHLFIRILIMQMNRMVNKDPKDWRKIAEKYPETLKNFCLETADEYDSGFEPGEYI